MANSYLAILVYLGFAEALRRCILTILSAFTGPLSKVPGPLVSKFTRLPWTFETITGKHMNTTTKLLQKYGDVVRVGECAWSKYEEGSQN